MNWLKVAIAVMFFILWSELSIGEDEREPNMRQPVYEQVSPDGVSLDIEAAKNRFLIYEPVIVYVTITNKTDRKIMIDTTSYTRAYDSQSEFASFSYIKIKEEKGRTLWGYRPSFCKDFLTYKIPQGDSLRIYVGLSFDGYYSGEKLNKHTFCDPFSKSGMFEIKLFLLFRNYTLASNTIRITTIKPEEDERDKKALNKIIEAKQEEDYWVKDKKVMLSLAESMLNEPLNLYAKYALLLSRHIQREIWKHSPCPLEFAETDEERSQLLKEWKLYFEKLSIYTRLLEKIVEPGETPFPLTDEALLRLAKCYENLYQTEKAIATLQRLLREYPASPFKQEVQELLKKLLEKSKTKQETPFDESFIDPDAPLPSDWYNRLTRTSTSEEEPYKEGDEPTDEPCEEPVDVSKEKNSSIVEEKNSASKTLASGRRNYNEQSAFEENKNEKRTELHKRAIEVSSGFVTTIIVVVLLLAIAAVITVLFTLQKRKSP
ncbi:MAG: tetratricopeptide repeat protein [Planctomycetota bacterium]|nr:tetratricopeptide repeat protein [Planctomycetota bacterium]